MAATKNLRTIIAAATSNGAGATTTGTVVNLTTAYGGFVTLKLTNGGTAPTVAAQFNVYTSGDNTNFKLFQVFVGDLVNNSVNQWSLDIAAPVMYVRVDCLGNTVQAVTCEAFLQELTTI
jgi:hypothetical protein